MPWTMRNCRNNRVIGGIAIKLSLPLPGCRETLFVYLRRSLCIPFHSFIFCTKMILKIRILQLHIIVFRAAQIDLELHIS